MKENKKIFDIQQIQQKNLHYELLIINESGFFKQFFIFKKENEN